MLMARVHLRQLPLGSCCRPFHWHWEPECGSDPHWMRRMKHHCCPAQTWSPAVSCLYHWCWRYWHLPGAAGDQAHPFCHLRPQRIAGCCKHMVFMNEQWNLWQFWCSFKEHQKISLRNTYFIKKFLYATGKVTVHHDKFYKGFWPSQTTLRKLLCEQPNQGYLLPHIDRTWCWCRVQS